MARVKNSSMNYKTDGWGKDVQKLPVDPNKGRPATPGRTMGGTEPVVKNTSTSGKTLNPQAQKAVNRSAGNRAKAAQQAVRANPRSPSLNIKMGPKKTAMGVAKKVASVAMASPLGRAVGAGLAVGAALSTTNVAKRAGTAVADYAGKVSGQTSKGLSTVNRATSSMPVRNPPDKPSAAKRKK